MPFVPYISWQKPNEFKEKKTHSIPLRSSLSVSFDSSYFGGKRPDLHSLLQKTNEQIPITLKHTFEFAYNCFPCNLQRYSSYINHRWKWIILSRSSNGFEEKRKKSHDSYWTWICLPNQWRGFFKSVHSLFSYALSNWQVWHCDR